MKRTTERAVKSFTFFSVSGFSFIGAHLLLEIFKVPEIVINIVFILGCISILLAIAEIFYYLNYIRKRTKLEKGKTKRNYPPLEVEFRTINNR